MVVHGAIAHLMVISSTSALLHIQRAMLCKVNMLQSGWRQKGFLECDKGSNAKNVGARWHVFIAPKRTKDIHLSRDQHPCKLITNAIQNGASGTGWS